MAIARKPRQGRLTIIHPTFGEEVVKVRQKGRTNNAPEINITTTESPLGEPEFDEEGGTPEREFTFSTPLYKNEPQRYYAGESYPFKNFIGSKDNLDFESGTIYISSDAVEEGETEGDNFITINYTCRISGYTRAARPISELT